MRYASQAHICQGKSHHKGCKANCIAFTLLPKLMREVKSMISQRNFRAQSVVQRYFARPDFESMCVNAVMHAVRANLRFSG